MANASYSIRPSINGNQHSQFPTGNYVPAPTVLNALVSPAGVALSFTDNSFGLARTVIQRSTSANGPFYDVINLPAGVTSYLNVQVPPGTYYYRAFSLAGNGSSTPSNTVSLTVPGSATGAQYRFTPPPIGTREFQIVNIPTAGLDSGTGAGQRYVITFATNSGYLLLAPPDSAITGMVDIETNAQTIVLHGAEFLPDFAVEKVTGPAGNLTVGKVLDIFTTGSNSPEIYLYKTKFRTTDDNGNVVWNAGDPINVGGTQSSDNTKWPLTYMEQNWVDNLYGFAVDTVGHTDVIKSNSGPVRGFRIARNRWACSYQFFILFTGHNETWGAYPGGTNEMFDNQWYSINPPPSWSEPVANNLYLSTSYTNQVSNGFYHAYLFNGTGAGGTDGYGTYINMSGNTQDANLGGIMSPPVGYGFQLNGNNLEAIAGQPPANRNNNMDWVQGNVYYGDHPKLNDTSTRDRPVMRAETGSAYRITTREQLEAIISASDTTPDAFSFTDQTGVSLSTVVTSAAITVSGINAAATITSSGGTFDINSSGTFVSSGTVNNGDTVRARVTSSSSNSAAANCVVTIGGVSDTFTATTLAASGSGLTIAGTGFGSSPGAAPFFVQKFGTNNGSSDASAVGYAAAQGAFGTNSYGSTLAINTSAGRGGRGALVMSMNFTPGGDRDFFPHVAVDTSNRGRGALNSQTLYYAYWVKLNRTSGTDATTYQIKGPRAGYASSQSANYYNEQPIYKVSHWAKGDGTYAYTYQEVVPTDSSYDNSEHFNFDSPAWRANDWNFVEGFMRFNDIGSANGVYYQRINGVDLNSGYPNAGNSRAITARISGDASKLFNFIFLTPGIDCPSTTAAVGLTLSFSEHYVDTTPQRVVMANHATNPYSASIWTIQEWNSWSSTSINIPALDFTGFASGATVYLHVFDASNTLVKSQSIMVP